MRAGFDLGVDVADDLLEDDVDLGAPLVTARGDLAQVFAAFLAGADLGDRNGLDGAGVRRAARIVGCALGMAAGVAERALVFLASGARFAGVRAGLGGVLLHSKGESELVLGRALRDFAKRDEIVIATKVYYPMRADANAGGLSRKTIQTEIDASLKRLGTAYVDLYQVHRWDHTTPIEETLEVLHDVVKAGKARYIGASGSHCVWERRSDRDAGRQEVRLLLVGTSDSRKTWRSRLDWWLVWRATSDSQLRAQRIASP